MLGGQLEDPAGAAALEWSSLLLRSFLMEAGLSMVEMEAPASSYMGYYVEAATGAPPGALAAAGGLIHVPDPNASTSSSSHSSAAPYFPPAPRQQQQQHHHHHHQHHHQKGLMMEDEEEDEHRQQQGQQSLLAVMHHNVMMAAAAAAQDEEGEENSSSTVNNISAGCTVQLGAWMDPRLWSRLPEKLLERVLASLPLPSFFRMRLVCKRWYNLLFSDSFLEACAKATPRARPWFLLVRQGSSGGEGRPAEEVYVFDPAGRAWFRLDLVRLLPPKFSVAAASGGLLCCISEARGCKTLLICNPLTRACVQLPQALKERFVPTVGLVRHPATGSYQVMAAGDDLISPFAVKNLTTEFYDSRAQQWRVMAPLPRLCNLESGKATYANGHFYCMNYSPYSILAYEIERGVWSKIQAPMRRFLRTPNLVECRGRLVLVAAVEKNKLNVPKSIRVWGLQQPQVGSHSASKGGGGSWVELERMPQALYEEFMRVSGRRAFHCTGHGNLILITLPDSPEMLLYDFYEKVWRWAPRCPFIDYSSPGPSAGPLHHHVEQGSSGGGGGFQAFPFDPRLEASVY